MLVRIKLAPVELMSSFYFSKQSPVSVAIRNIDEYTACPLIYVEAETPEDAAEEAFDLTNNPGRQADRLMFYGRGRSVSVGDIVEVENRTFLCAQMGWIDMTRDLELETA